MEKSVGVDKFLMITLKIEGIENIQDEFEKKFMPRVQKAITGGLKSVANDMIGNLQQHIKDDVYLDYTPINYIRRANDKGMLDKNNIPAIDQMVHGNTLTFLYSFPVGESKWKSESSYYEYSDGDDAIRAIQTGKGYPTIGDLYVDGRLKARPFWKNFIDDFLIGGKADNSLATGMNSIDDDLKVIGKSQKAKEIGDSELIEAPNGNKIQHGSRRMNWEDGEDLPF